MKYSVLAMKSVTALKNSPRPLQWRPSLLVACCAVSIASLSFAQTARAVSPPPDGGYPNDNTAEGDSALFDLDVNNSTDNTAVGFEAMHFNVVTFGNTAVGSQALEFGSSGNYNVAVGFSALFQDGTGNNNTAIGTSAIGLTRFGSNNTGVGNGALFFNDSGNNNSCLGFNSLANSTGSSNIAIGASAGTNLSTGSNNIYIGSAGGSAGESKRIRIGTMGTQNNTFIAGIFGVTVATGIPVIVDSSGRLGTTTSSNRFKDAIKPMDKASEAILALKPVTFHYKKELDANKTAQFGLVAEEVEKVDPDLVVRDEQGKPYTVRYDAVNAMLLNEFIKEHRRLEATMATVAEQQKEIQVLMSQIQKVSAQVAVSSPAPQVAVNNQ